MIKYFTLSEFEKIEEYSIDEKGSMTTEKPKDPEKAAKQSNPDKKDTIYPEEAKDKKTGEEKVVKTAIPKDAQVKALAKELFKAQYRALTLQNDIDNALDAMAKVDPANPKIATATASGALQVANAQLRADTIEMQMVAIGSADKTGNLTIVATELAAEAKNLAMKKALDEFGEIVLKWKKDAEDALKDKEKSGSKEEEPKK